MSDSKVLIKIKTDKSRSPMSYQQPIVTVWHTRRIVVALAALISLIGILVWLFSVSGSNQDETATVAQVAETTGGDAGQADHSPVPVAPAVNKAPVTMAEKSNAPAGIILDKKVIRASLNTGLKANEPDARPQLPIRLGAGDALELHYFTEVKNMPGKTVQHLWFFNGKQVGKKTMAIKGKVFKAVSSRVLTIKDLGNWQVKLVNEQGKSLSEANFQVVEQGVGKHE